MADSKELAQQARQPLPDMIERGATNAMTLVVMQSGSVITFDAAVFTLLDASGATVTTAAATSGPSGVAYSYAAPSTLTLGEGYQVVWTLTKDGLVNTVRNTASVVRRRLFCPIDETDLFRMAPSLDPDGDAPITAETDFGDYLTEAWTQIQLRLIEAGNRPSLIVEPSALREATLHLTLSIIFGAMAHRLNMAYQSLSESHHQRFVTAWSRVRLVYADADAATFDAARRRATAGPVWLGRG